MISASSAKRTENARALSCETLASTVGYARLAVAAAGFAAELGTLISFYKEMFLGLVFANLASRALSREVCLRGC